MYGEIYKKVFNLTEDHLKLLRAMYVNWNDNAYEGAPAIDIKRPYGNSDVITDIAEILGVELEEDYQGELIITKEFYDRCMKLHSETETAMQIVLYHAGKKAKPGSYVSYDICHQEWQRVE